MTEYDYSPEAYEQYLSKQRAITRWVDEANQYTPANPFVPLELPTPLNRPRSAAERNYDSDSDDGHSGSRRHHDRDGRHRSQRRDSHRSHSSKRRSKSSAPSSPSFAQRTSPYTSLPTDQHHPYSYSSPYNQPRQYPYNYTTNAQQYTYPSKSSTTTPHVYTSAPQVYAPSPRQKQPLVVPIRTGTGGYVVVPPPGVSYQVLHPQQPQSPSSPTQPWYKRVFSPTPSTDSGANKLAKSSSSSSRKKRSSRKWEWDIY